MKVKMILPALADARGPFWRAIKYTRFPPLGLATLAAYLDEADQVHLQDEHVEHLDLDDCPDLVVLQVYITSAYRSYAIADHYRARGAHVCMGGLHPTSLPREAAEHADSVFLGPGEDTFPRFLRDFRAGRARRVYRSTHRSLVGAPPPRRDLIKDRLYLVPNTLVVSRGCPHHCDFCYKDAFYRGGSGYYTMAVDQALAEIERLPGRHLCFLDDNLFASPPFASGLFEGLRGAGRLWLSAGTVQAVLSQPRLIEQAVEAGLRSLFIGFESLSEQALRSVNKMHNVHRDYDECIRRLHGLGVMVNASIVFGMDGEDPSIFDRTLEWTITRGLESATFHVLTPYPGTPLYQRMKRQGRILTDNWDLYDTRHAVFRPSQMTAGQLEEGYWKANTQFGSFRSIWRSAATKRHVADRVRHFLFSTGLRRYSGTWAWIIRHGQMRRMVPVMESVLSAFGRYGAAKHNAAPVPQSKTVSEARIC